MKTDLKILFGILIILVLTGNILASAQVQEVKVTVLSPYDIKVYSPINETIYNTKNVPINISLSSNAEIMSSDNNGDLKKLCSDCDEYGYTKTKKKSFKDGLHEFFVKTIFEDYIGEFFINFFVDSKGPKIKNTNPDSGEFASGLFEIEFEEDNPSSLVLNYGNQVVGYRNNVIDLNTCLKEKKSAVCKINVNLTDFNLQDLEYWFELKDIANNAASSNKLTVKADFTKPYVNYFNFTINKKNVEFFMDVKEENFKEVLYIDWNSKNPEWKTLCQRLKEGDGICKNSVSFSKGEHNISLKIVDKAENQEFIDDVMFNI